MDRLRRISQDTVYSGILLFESLKRSASQNKIFSIIFQLDYFLLISTLKTMFISISLEVQLSKAKSCVLSKPTFNFPAKNRKRDRFQWLSIKSRIDLEQNEKNSLYGIFQKFWLRKKRWEKNFYVCSRKSF